jgi:hypothetical protein
MHALSTEMTTPTTPDQWIKTEMVLFRRRRAGALILEDTNMQLLVAQLFTAKLVVEVS